MMNIDEEISTENRPRRDYFQHLKITGFKEERSTVTLIENGITCGFTSPAIDYIEKDISLQDLFIRNRSATFLGRIVGNSLINSGFEPGGIIVIDRSITPRDGNIAICFLNGYFTAKKLEIKKNKNEIWLIPDCDGMEPLLVTPDDEFTIWGIVTWKCNPTI